MMALIATLISAAFNVSLCMWGCPKSLFAYSLQASFFIALVVVVGAIYTWIKATKKYKDKSL